MGCFQCGWDLDFWSFGLCVRFGCVRVVFLVFTERSGLLFLGAGVLIVVCGCWGELRSFS